MLAVLQARFEATQASAALSLAQARSDDVAQVWSRLSAACGGAGADVGSVSDSHAQLPPGFSAVAASLALVDQHQHALLQELTTLRLALIQLEHTLEVDPNLQGSGSGVVGDSLEYPAHCDGAASPALGSALTHAGSATTNTALPRAQVGDPS